MNLQCTTVKVNLSFEWFDKGIAEVQYAESSRIEPKDLGVTKESRIIGTGVKEETNPFLHRNERCGRLKKLYSLFLLLYLIFEEKIKSLGN